MPLRKPAWPLLALLLAGCLPSRPPEPVQSPMRQVIRMQLDSINTEPPTAPVPASEAPALGQLRPLRGGLGVATGFAGARNRLGADAAPQVAP